MHASLCARCVCDGGREPEEQSDKGGLEDKVWGKREELQPLRPEVS